VLIVSQQTTWSLAILKEDKKPQKVFPNVHILHTFFSDNGLFCFLNSLFLHFSSFLMRRLFKRGTAEIDIF